MTTFPGSVRLAKGGLVLLDPLSGTVRDTVIFQFNPETVSRTLQVQSVGGEEGERSGPLRLKGPPVETFKFDAEIDAADQLDAGDPVAAQNGIQPQLSAIETLVYPTSGALQKSDALAREGTLEIAAPVAPLTLLIWSRNRIVPGRITELSITEEAFDPALNPLRAKLSIGFRMQSVLDVGLGGVIGSVSHAHHQRKESLAALAPGGALGALGIGAIT